MPTGEREEQIGSLEAFFEVHVKRLSRDSEADPRKAQRVLARPALMDDIGKKRKLNGRKNYVRSKKPNRFACGCGNIRVGAIAIA
jgi:hypothetical protein